MNRASSLMSKRNIACGVFYNLLMDIYPVESFIY